MPKVEDYIYISVSLNRHTGTGMTTHICSKCFSAIVDNVGSSAVQKAHTKWHADQKKVIDDLVAALARVIGSF